MARGRAKAEKSRRKRVTPEQRAGATPETAAKLKEDQIARLQKARKLDDAHRTAADEIRMVHAAIFRGRWNTGKISGSWERPTDFLDRMTKEELRIWERRYSPWARASSVRIASRGNHTLCELVTAIAIDNLAPKEVAEDYDIPESAVIGYLAAGLEMYFSA